MTKILSRKVIILIIIPLFAIFLQGFLRYVLKLDFNTIGITLAAVGVGQLLPFCYFDHLVANKILGISPHYKTMKGELQITYKASSNIKDKDIEAIQNLILIAIFFELALFIITIYLGLSGYILYHIILGSFTCIISWYLLIFK